MKNVECLLSGIKAVERKGAVVTEVSGVESDSRQVKKDNLFVAVRGASVDGAKSFPKSRSRKCCM